MNPTTTSIPISTTPSTMPLTETPAPMTPAPMTPAPTSLKPAASDYHPSTGGQGAHRSASAGANASDTGDSTSGGRAGVAKVAKWIGSAVLATAALIVMPGVAAASAYPPATDPPATDPAASSDLYFYTEEGSCSYGDDGILTGGSDPLIFGMRTGTGDTQVKVTISANSGSAAGASGSVVLYSGTYELTLSNDKEWLTGYTEGRWAYQPGKIDLDTVTATLVGVQSGETATPLKLSCPLNEADYKPYWEERGSDGNGAATSDVDTNTPNPNTPNPNTPNLSTPNTAAAATGQLPSTGTGEWAASALACTLVGAGGLLVALSRRRRNSGATGNVPAQNLPAQNLPAQNLPA